MSDESLRAAVSAIWERAREAVLERVGTLDVAARAALAGTLSTELRRTAEREAHKLAGAVGSFGFWEASTLAREIEQLLGGDDLISPSGARHLVDLAAQMRQQLEAGIGETGDAGDEGEDHTPAAPRPRLLLIATDRDLRDRVAVEARSLGVDVVASQTVDDARTKLTAAVDAVVLDLSLDGGGTALLEELHTSRPVLPVIVISSGDAFQDRVDAARLGGRGFLQKPVRPSQIFELLRDTLVLSHEELPTIVAVDDDRDLLTLIEAILTPIGVHFVKCHDPMRALNYLVEYPPDLVMLDVDMPGVNGIELCRVLRNDPRWAATPILFLTARTEPASVLRMFEAGADDFVAKPVLGPELVARVRNRLERTRMLRLAADVDSLTGVATRRRGVEVLERFFRLAQRQQMPISMASIDLDHFKQVNDRYGHLVGDMVLRRVAATLSAGFRGEDIVARWGGEEFLVAMYSIPGGSAARRLEQALERLRHETFEAAGQSFGVTFSAGVAEFPSDASNWMSLYRVADDALSRAKAGGRNRIESTRPMTRARTPISTGSVPHADPRRDPQSPRPSDR